MRKYILLALLLVALTITVVACSTNPGTPGNQVSGNTVSDVSGSPPADVGSTGTTDPGTGGTSTGTTGTTGSTGTGGTTGTGGSTTGTTGTGSGDVKVINIVARRFSFTVTGPEIHVGDKVKLVVSSEDGTHGFAMPGYNIDLGPLNPGDAPQEIEFTADKAGTFNYFCNVPCGPGHRDMNGQLTVLA